MGDGVEGEAGRGFDAQLGGDVLAVRQDGVDTDVESGSDLFVRQTFDNEAEDVLLALREAVALVVDHGQEDAVADTVMLADVSAEGVDGEEDGVAEVLVVGSGKVLEHNMAHVIKCGLDGLVVVRAGLGAWTAATLRIGGGE